jgi:hypothetical protein
MSDEEPGRMLLSWQWIVLRAGAAKKNDRPKRD